MEGVKVGCMVVLGLLAWLSAMIAFGPAVGLGILAWLACCIAWAAGPYCWATEIALEYGAWGKPVQYLTFVVLVGLVFLPPLASAVVAGRSLW